VSVSFIEKNKAWILPLLGVAAAGVVYLNIRTLSAPPAPPAPAPTPEAGAPAPPSAPAPAPEGTSSGDLWEDLRKFAVPPASLADENSFRDQARRSIPGALRAPSEPLALSAPVGVREPLAAPEPGPKAGPGPGTPSNPPPGLDFLIQGPNGSRAWLEGRPYRSGESVPGQPLKVGTIGFASVELKGPKGKTILSTNPLHPSGPRPVVEAQ
jgi:hypothetical protein